MLPLLFLLFFNDPAFENIPFEQWLGAHDDARFKFSLQTLPARLSVHQRLTLQVSTEIEGSEFAKHGPLIVFLEIRDANNRTFRTHREMKFDELKNPSSVSSVHFNQPAFLTPGDYRVTAAIYDTRSKEHALRREKVHVAALAHDPLPGASEDLPEVEFVSAPSPPDAWYLPEISSRLSLPVKTAQPVRVEVIVNESTTELAMRRGARGARRNLSTLIPALKVISQLDIRNGSINVTLLDLERRTAAFTQEHVGTLDWRRLSSALDDNDPNLIDVHALENYTQKAQFFLSEIRKRLERSDAGARVLIVLSGPMAFAKGQDLRPIEAAPEPGTKVFYIRYFPPFGPQDGPSLPGQFLNGGRAAGVPPASPGRGAILQDSLAATLKPLAPRVFDVTTPMEFRNALASIMSAISQAK